MNDELSVKPQHAIPKPAKPFIPTRVSGTPPRVHRAVNFNDEANGWREQIDDVAAPQHDLTAKVDTELTTRHGFSE